MESHIHGNVNVWLGGGDTHVPTGYDGLYPTVRKKISVAVACHRSLERSRVLAYVFGTRKDEVFLQLKALLEPFGITRYHTEYWGA